MFELPYLEIYAEIFEKRLKNRTLESMDIPQEKCGNVSKAELTEHLVGNELKKVWREGLSLWFQFDNYAVLEMTFLPSAELKVLEQGQEAELDSEIFNLYFGGGQTLSIKNAKKLNVFRLSAIHSDAPDVFSREMTLEYLINLFADRDEEIKPVLMNQSLIRGIEECFADEILWYAEISPFSIVSKIPVDRMKILHRTIKYVFLDTIKQIKRINFLKLDKMNVDLLMIHNPDKVCSPTGNPIKVEIQDGITTYYTDEQTLYV